MRNRDLGRNVLGALAVAFATMCVAEANRVRLDGVAAFVNDEVITISEVVRLSRELQAGLAEAVPDVDALNELYVKALDVAVGRRLILKAYGDQKRIVIPDTMVQERVDTIVNTAFHGDRAALVTALAQDGLTYDAWQAQIRDNIVIGAMRNVEVDSKVRISPVAVRERYTAHPEAFKHVGRARLHMLVLPADQQTKAARLAAELRAGADFEALAREHSTGARAAAGGDRGWMELDMLRDELAAVARSVPVGEVSAPSAVGDELYILRVDEREGGGMPPFEEVQPQIEATLRREAAQDLYGAWIDALRRDAFVKVVEAKPF